MEKPIIAISSCLLGNKVRYDGNDTYNDWAYSKLGAYFTLYPICPEMEMGLGSPRETMNLYKIKNQVRLITTETKKDKTQLLDLTIHKLLSKDLVPLSMSLCGHIFQERSPSCGLKKVKLYLPNESLLTNEKNSGLYAKAFMKEFPLVPVIESKDLVHPKRRGLFVCQAIAYYRFNFLEKNKKSLLIFHSQYEKFLFKLNPEKLGHLKKVISINDETELFTEYKSEFFKMIF